MTIEKIKIILLSESFAIAKIKNLPSAWLENLISEGSFFCYMHDKDESSIICEDIKLPEFIECEKEWAGIKIEGPISFEVSGMLIRLIEPISKTGNSVLVTSTFSTDYIFFKSVHRELILESLSDIVILKKCN